jgi:hypothetical protein
MGPANVTKNKAILLKTTAQWTLHHWDRDVFSTIINYCRLCSNF